MPPTVLPTSQRIKLRSRFYRCARCVAISAIGCLLCCLFASFWMLGGVMMDPEDRPQIVHGVHHLIKNGAAQQQRINGTTIFTAAQKQQRQKDSVNTNNKESSASELAFETINRQQRAIKQQRGDIAVLSKSDNDKAPLVMNAQGQKLEDKELPNADAVEALAQKEKNNNNNNNKAIPRNNPQQDINATLVKNREKKATAITGIVPLSEQQEKPRDSLVDLMPLSDDKDDWIHKPVARGVAGLPLSETPAVVGAQRAHIANCDINVDSLAYWNDPVGARDLNFQSPFVHSNNNNNHGNTPKQSQSQQEQHPMYEEQFITFPLDWGGWNNIRMAMEVMFVLACITNRTLVMPPKSPVYLLNLDTKSDMRGYADFFPLHDHANFPVKLMSMHDFLTQNPQQQYYLSTRTNASAQEILRAAQGCVPMRKADIPCTPLLDYLQEVGHNVNWRSLSTCVMFDLQAYHGHTPSPKSSELVSTYCTQERTVVYWNENDHGRYNHLNFPVNDEEDRLMAHFYNMMHFSDPVVGNYAKRFVRDYLHYNDAIYCAAGKIVKALQTEAIQRGFVLDAEKGGGYSALHVRRGDLQYQEVKFSGEEWYNNTKDIWLEHEILYIATDEKNMSFFNEFARHYPLRFLHDYWDLAGLSKVDPNYIGMIDTIVASRSRAYAGTWFSTFSGYINRLRGYHGLSMMNSWYSFLPRKKWLHEWVIVPVYKYQFEWQDAWVGIDGDEFPARDKF